MKALFSILTLLLFTFKMHAQNGEIAGKVTDENGEGIPKATVSLASATGVPQGKSIYTDYDGNFSLRPLAAGTYNLQVSYVGYTTVFQQGIIVKADMPTWMNLRMKSSDAMLDAVEVIEGGSQRSVPANSTQRKIKYNAPKAKRNKKPL